MSDIPMWLEYVELVTRHEMRWHYRLLGKKIPKLSWEVDDTSANKLEALVDREAEAEAKKIL